MVPVGTGFLDWWFGSGGCWCIGGSGWVAWPREVVNHHPVGHFGSPCLRLGHEGCRPVDAHIVTMVVVAQAFSL